MKYSTIIKLAIISILSISINVIASDDPPKEFNGMLLNEDAKVDLAYSRPDVDWKKFNTIYIRELSVTDEAKDATPRRPETGRGHRRDSWIIPEKDIQIMKDEFTKRIVKAIEDSGLKVVTEIQADTLVLLPNVIDIYLTAPIEKSRDNYGARGSTFTDGAGSMTISVTFADGGTKQVIAYAVDNRYPSSMWSRNTRIQNISEMKRLFNSWGKSLAKAIKKIKQ